MTITICENRRRILEAKGHVLVLGGPGSGKTTIALLKAVSCICAGLQPGQAVLFLSFSNAAVARIAAASKTEVDRDKRNQLQIQTFHSFCWGILRSHGYLAGCPKRRLNILLPHDEKAMSGGLKPPQKGEEPSDEWLAWDEERRRLFDEEGRAVFDLFAPKTVELLERSSLLRSGLSDRYPVIIVDEAQDTGADAWRCIELLSEKSQVVCLGDLTQQIFDHLEGVGPERIEHIRNALHPLEVDIGQGNNRSVGTEISLFAQNILSGTVRTGAYVGVSRQMYNPKGDASKRFRIALSNTYKVVKKLTGQWPESVAILAASGAGVGRVTSALNSGAKPVRHRVLFDEASVLLSARMAAFILEPKVEDRLHEDVASLLEYLASLRRINGTRTALTQAGTYMRWATSIREGSPPRTNLAKAVESLIRARLDVQLSGDPGKDWIQVKTLLRGSGQRELSDRARDLDYLIAFNRGRRIAANLADLWIEEGAYTRAREALDRALMETQLLAGVDSLKGIHVMTIHKSKGKQFDAVVILREGICLGPRNWQSSLVWRDDPPPHVRSRKILRVGITRAKSHVLLLEPFYPVCPILTPHSL